MCTGIRLIAEDGSPIFGRTMEFGGDMLRFNLVVVPRNHEFTGGTPEGENGMKWTVDYGFVTAVPYEMVSCGCEGVNEAGLQGGAFFFQPYAKARWQDPDPAQYEKTIAGWQICSYILSKAKSVEDIKRLLPEVRVVGAVLFPPNPGWNFEPMVHFAFNDVNGGAVVVEYLEGELHVFDNPLGTLTNAPEFPWHQENLMQFTNLPIDQSAPFGEDVIAHGASGLDIGAKLNLPGEMTSQNRFVRAALFSQHAMPFKDAQGGVERVTNILHNFDIPMGYKLYKHTDGKEYAQYTQWTSTTDMRARRLYFRTFVNPTIQYIDLNDLNLSGGDIKQIPVSNEFMAQPVSLP